MLLYGNKYEMSNIWSLLNETFFFNLILVILFFIFIFLIFLVENQTTVRLLCYEEVQVAGGCVAGILDN
jgi:hypothetical protein